MDEPSLPMHTGVINFRVLSDAGFKELLGFLQTARAAHSAPVAQGSSSAPGASVAQRLGRPGLLA